MNLNQKILRKTNLLWALLYFVTIVVALSSTQKVFPDTIGYTNMGLGLLEGKFSSWYFLEKFYPETLRMPGYPLLVGVSVKIFKSHILVYLVQISALLTMYHLGFMVLQKLVPQKEFRSTATKIFLILCIASIQLPYYAGQIAPQALTGFFLMLFFYLLSRDRNPHRRVAVAQGVVLGILFQLTPALLLLPLLLLPIILERQKITKATTLVSGVIFIMTTLPFGLWNYTNHGTFKITPLEGGAGAAHMGFWQYKLPKNYSENFYWGNNTGDDLVYPFRESDDLARAAVEDFEVEWHEVHNAIVKYKTEEDLHWERIMRKENPGQFVLQSSVYTRAREEALWALTLKHALNEPSYYVKTRVYNFFRCYFTGISENRLREAKSMAQLFSVIYPFFITFTLVLLGLAFVVTNAIRSWGTLDKNHKILLATVLYFGVVHMPFVTQARYSVPVHCLVFLLVSVFFAPIVKRLTDRTKTSRIRSCVHRVSP